MAYGQIKGRRPLERASKIAHTEILNNPDVQAFVAGCTLPSAPPGEQIADLQKPLPAAEKRIKAVIAVDGGMTEVAVRKEFPTASVTYTTFGPLLLNLEDVQEIDRTPFIAPEDMARLKNLKRYSLVLPTKAVRAPGVGSFRDGVRKTIQSFMSEKQPELMAALRWLLYREWTPGKKGPRTVPKCPSCEAEAGGRSFEQGGPIEQTCQACGREIYFTDVLRLYERIDEEQGAGGIVGYLLSTLEQLVIVHVIRSILELRPATLREVLLIRDGPLAFFGVVAPLRRPMMELMAHLAGKDNGKPLICLVGLEKGGHFVEHAALVAPELKPNHYLMLDSEYVYKFVQPGDPNGSPFGSNTYYGGKLIYKSARGDVFVATIPMTEYRSAPKIDNLLNAPEVLSVIAELRCAMYDSALLPVVLANRLVSLADVPSKEILQRFTKAGVDQGA